MALFEDEKDIPFEEEYKNPYLNEPQKGIDLIKSIVSPRKEHVDTHIYEDIIENQIFPVIAELKLDNGLELYQSLVKIGNRLKEYQKIKLLNGKKVLGVGGQFSAGKSLFINSITNVTLPVGQRPTTSIATYILNADKDENIAISRNDSIIALDDDAVEAITHEFDEKYNIGFSKLIQNLVIYSPEFSYPNIAILDTPGYSKAEIYDSGNNTDREIARQQLRASDFIIWLVDGEKGVMDENDIKFLSTLNIDTEILIIITKAGLMTPDEAQKKLEHTKETIKNTNIKVFDVIAYDSGLGEEIIGEGILEKFFSHINKMSNVKFDISKQINKIRIDIEKQLNEQIKSETEKLTALGNVLASSEDSSHILPVVKEYGKIIHYLPELRSSEAKLNKHFSKLKRLVENIGEKDQ